MTPIIEENREALTALCRKYGVARLELFGSAADGSFHPEQSDLDFLVEFETECSMGPFHQYFDFLADLKALFGREVDLVESSAMRNPHFIRAVNANRKLVYAP